MNQRILYVRLPCNPIFPIGVVYLADRVHKVFEEIEQKFSISEQYRLWITKQRWIAGSMNLNLLYLSFPGVTFKFMHQSGEEGAIHYNIPLSFFMRSIP